METILSERDEFYKETLINVCDKIEGILEKNLLDYKKAKTLSLEYSNIVKEIEEDLVLSEEDKDSWAVALSECYEPFYNQLVFRMASILPQ